MVHNPSFFAIATNIAGRAKSDHFQNRAYDELAVLNEFLVANKLRTFRMLHVCALNNVVCLYDKWAEIATRNRLDGPGIESQWEARFFAPVQTGAGWASGSVWTGAEYLANTGIRSPDRPARTDSLYRLSNPGPLQCTV